MKVKSILVVSALIFGMLIVTTFAQPTATMLASTTERKVQEVNTTNLSKTNKQTSNTYDYSTATFKKDNAVGKYIKIMGLSDGAKQKKMNAILKADAKAILNLYDTSKATTLFEMKVTGKYIKDTNLFIAIYTGEYNNLESAYPTSFYYVSVINVEKASRVTYTDKSELAKIKKAIQKGNFTCNTKDTELAAAQENYLKGLSDKELDRLLSSINIKLKKGKVTLPQIFMYKTKTTIQLSIPAIHVIGDHIDISIKNSAL